MTLASDVRVLRSVEEIEELRPLWESWPGNRDSDIDFYQAVLRSNSQAVRPHVIVVYRQGQPEAMLVGRIEATCLDFKVGYLHVKPKAVVLYFVYGALRGKASAQSVELIVKDINAALSRGEADVAYLNFLRTDSSICEVARKAPGVFCRDYILATQPHFAATIPRGIEEFYRGLSPKFRSQVRSKQRRLLKDFSGAVRMRRFREPGEVEEMIRDVEQIARQSYQRGLGVGFRDTPDTRERLCLKARKGWLRAYVLYVADRPCAYWVGDRNEQTFGSDYLGYDASLGKYSPGLCLIVKVMEELCAETETPVDEVDFASGHAQYKEVLGNRTWQEASVYIFAPTWKGVELNLVRFLTGSVHQAIKALFRRTTLLQRVRKSWRMAVTNRESQGSEAV